MVFQKKWLAYCAAMFFLFIFSCDSNKQIFEDQKRTHREFESYFEKTFLKTEAKVDYYAKKLQEQYQLRGDCKYKKPSKSSIYIPKSAKIGKKLDCFLEVSEKLDDEFEDFYNDLKIISWQYVYDGETKALRIHPATEPESLFGDDLTFDGFSFYKGALQNFPNGIWSDLKDDINGTGKILIYSKAFKLIESDNYSVVGIDLNTDELLKKNRHNIISFSKERKGKNILFKSYLKKGNRYQIIHNFSLIPSPPNVIFKADKTVDEKFIKEVEQTSLGMKCDAKLKKTRIRKFDSDFLCTYNCMFKYKVHMIFCTEK